MLNTLSEFPSFTTADRISVRVPHLHLFLSDSNTQIIEDIPDAIDLKSILITPTTNNLVAQSAATSIGYALGSWLRSFHTWASLPTHVDLRKDIVGNEAMRKLKFNINYNAFIQVLENYPDVLKGHRKTLEDVRDLAAREFEKNVGEEVGEDWGIIHGDFWSGK
jgi:hypothetical protein